MALADVASSREGRRAMAAVEEEGRLGKVAFRKAFSLDVPEPPEPTPTRAEQRLDTLATSIAKARGITKEQAFVEAVGSDEGRELHRAHRAEMAAR